MTSHIKTPELFLSLPHACSYLPNHEATTLFIDPNGPELHSSYCLLIRKGFRRSGKLVYRPHCSQCAECISVRIPVNEFQPRRTQRRIKQRNHDLVITETMPRFSEEHFALYKKYQHARHAGESMDNGDPAAYQDFLVSSPADTRFLEFRAGDGKLMAVAVFDVVDDGLSAVYTFFDPGVPRRGLGILAILQEIEITRYLGLSHLYLGFWIAGCRKMAYKGNYRPLQGYIDDEWRDLLLD